MRPSVTILAIWRILLRIMAMLMCIFFIYTQKNDNFVLLSNRKNRGKRFGGAKEK